MLRGGSTDTRARRRTTQPSWTATGLQPVSLRCLVSSPLLEPARWAHGPWGSSRQHTCVGVAVLHVRARGRASSCLLCSRGGMDGVVRGMCVCGMYVYVCLCVQALGMDGPSVGAVTVVVSPSDGAPAVRCLALARRTRRITSHHITSHHITSHGWQCLCIASYWYAVFDTWTAENGTHARVCMRSACGACGVSVDVRARCYGARACVYVLCVCGCVCGPHRRLRAASPSGGWHPNFSRGWRLVQLPMPPRSCGQAV